MMFEGIYDEENTDKEKDTKQKELIEFLNVAKVSDDEVLL